MPEPIIVFFLADLEKIGVQCCQFVGCEGRFRYTVFHGDLVILAIGPDLPQGFDVQRHNIVHRNTGQVQQHHVGDKVPELCRWIERNLENLPPLGHSCAVATDRHKAFQAGGSLADLGFLHAAFEVDANQIRVDLFTHPQST